MTIDKTLEKLMKLEEKNRKLPPLSAAEAKSFDTDNMMGSVFYSNLLEGNTLSKEEAIKAMLQRDDRNYK